MPQTRIGDLVVVEVQDLQLAQPRKMFQALVRNLCVAEVKPSQLGQLCQILQPYIRDCSADETQALKSEQQLFPVKERCCDLSDLHETS